MYDTLTRSGPPPGADAGARPATPVRPEASPSEIIAWLPALRANARALTRNATEADDLVQDTLVKAIRHIGKFEPGTNMRAWLFTIMRNTFYNTAKIRARETTGGADCVSSNPSVPPTQEWTIAGRELMAAVNRLPSHYREILVLVVMLGETYETAAEICGCKIGTVKSRVNRARALVVADLTGVPVSS